MGELKIAESYRGRGKVATVVAPSAAIKPLFITAHVPKRKYGHNVVQIVSNIAHGVLVASIEAGSPALLRKVVA